MTELQEFRPQVVFHLAAGFERSKESPEFWSANWHDNVLLSHRIVHLLKDSQEVGVFVFASSYLVYAPSLYLSPRVRERVVPLHEDSPISPRNLCGAAKYYTERELACVKELFDLPLRTVLARIFRVYGRGSRDVISRWVRAGIQGETIDLYNKESQFDFVFAGDVAEGLLRLAETPEAAGAVNLGSGSSRSIEELVGIIGGQISGTALKIRDAGQVEELEGSCADVTKLRALTGWVPGQISR